MSTQSHKIISKVKYHSSSSRPPVPGKEDNLIQSIIGTFSDDSSLINGLESGSKIKGSLTDPNLFSSKPEGSDVAYQTASQESSNSSGGLAHLRWNENFAYLMDDIDGVKLFKEFLEKEKLDLLVEFWFACNGLKIKVSENPKCCSSLAKSIYKKYVKGHQMPLKSTTKRKIVENLKANIITDQIFDGAQSEIEELLKQEHYPRFLQSETFHRFAESELENSKFSSHSNNSLELHSLQPPRSLPPLSETREFSCSSIEPSLSFSSASYFSNDEQKSFDLQSLQNSLNQQNDSKFSSQPRHYDDSFINKSTDPSKYQPYLQTSMRSSKAQSLASDVTTDDTVSFTSSSQDGCDFFNRGNSMKIMSKPQRNQNNNNHLHKNKHFKNNNTNLNSSIIPRTQRMPTFLNNIAETNPHQFAQQLISRLNVLKQDQTETEIHKKTLNNKKNQGASGMAAFNKLLSMLSNNASPDPEREAYNVLEQQCSILEGRSTKTNHLQCLNHSSRHHNHHHSHSSRHSNISNISMPFTPSQPPSLHPHPLHSYSTHHFSSCHSQLKQQNYIHCNNPALSDLTNERSETNTNPLQIATASNSSLKTTVVGYYFCEEPIPYRTTIQGTSLTLAQFKNLVSKRGHFRYYFKRACPDFENGIVHEEVSNDNQLLPLWEGKILCKIEPHYPPRL